MMVGLSLMSSASCRRSVRPPNTMTMTVEISAISGTRRVRPEDTANATIAAAMNAAVAAKMPQRELAMKNSIRGPSSSTSLSAGWMGGLADACTEWFDIVSSPNSPLHAGDRGGEIARHERLEIVDPLPDPDEMHRQPKSFRDRHQNAAARRAVELGHGKPGHAGRPGEFLDLG